MSWEWELRLESSVIGSGNGFDEANKATISVDLPLAQYSSNPVFYISVETVDGTVHDITRTVNPLPMRTVQVEFKDSLVVGEEAEFEWRLEGIYLNQMDNIQKIDLLTDKQLGSSRTVFRKRHEWKRIGSPGINQPWHIQCGDSLFICRWNRLFTH